MITIINLPICVGTLEVFMNKKNNKQFQNSTTRMENAMLKLINQTPFEKITVRLICEKPVLIVPPFMRTILIFTI